ncbi:MAG TPA: methyltransferase domain-containing protein [Vicinamibacterales bacterium]|nr:methyltransferase domain-containing protein [Vicinamibacterales bacterium]
MGWLRKQEDVEPLPVAMTGVRLGDRLLAIGAADPPLVALLARKTGLTGRVCLVDPDPTRANHAAAAVERAGALVEPISAPWGDLPLDANSFDVAVARDALLAMPPDVRARCLADVFRVLRSGGRLVVIEPSGRAGGLTSLLSRKTAISTYSSGGATEALTAAGFAAVRVIAERDGILYVEAAKRTTT